MANADIRPKTNYYGTNSLRLVWRNPEGLFSRNPREKWTFSKNCIQRRDLTLKIFLIIVVL